MVKYLIKHWINADFIAEKVVDGSEINTTTNDLGKYKIPDGSFKYTMIKNSEKINRTSYEDYGEDTNNSSKERISNK